MKSITYTCPLDGHYRFEWESEEGPCFGMKFMKADEEFEFPSNSIPESRTVRLVA